MPIFRFYSTPITSSFTAPLYSLLPPLSRPFAQVLQQFEALNEDTSATDLGRMVGSLSADNELWLALVLRRDSVQQLTAAELGAVMCSIVVDGYKASNAYFKYRPSDNVEAVYNDLEQLSWDLKLAQTEANIGALGARELPSFTVDHSYIPSKHPHTQFLISSLLEYRVSRASESRGGRHGGELDQRSDLAGTLSRHFSRPRRSVSHAEADCRGVAADTAGLRGPR